MYSDPNTASRSCFDSFERSACFSDPALASRLRALETRAALKLGILRGGILESLVASASTLAFRPARYEVGKPEARVYQEFGYCDAVPQAHALSHLAHWLEWRLQRALRLMDRPPIPVDFSINDVVCQQYRSGDLGITPHRDHIAYTGLILLVILSGGGSYYVCADRSGHGKRVIDTRPGDAVLMPGPGYAGRRDRPFHAVERIRGTRYSVGLRHDSRRGETRSVDA